MSNTHWKRRARDVQAVLLQPRAERRPLPDFLLVGAMRAGTTSLYAWLLGCPSVLPARRKEVHYFDRLPAHSERWYRTFFPTESQRAKVEATEGVAITGEATPAYLCHPPAADSAFATVPSAAIIVILRDPVLRAWSQYLHEQQMGRERRPFADVIAAELRARDEGAEHPYGLIARGRYAQQLTRWRQLYGDRMLILVSEDLFGEPEVHLRRVADHLEIAPSATMAFPSLNHGRGPTPEADDLRALRTVFEEDNSDLQALLGRPLPWGALRRTEPGPTLATADQAEF